jgi:hypothetical protein
MTQYRKLDCDCIVNERGFLEIECHACEEAARQPERRAQPVDLGDPEVNADLLDERSERISDARDAAFERGQDYYAEGQSENDRDEAAARYFDHTKLQADFCEGWNTAKQEAEICSRVPS